MTKAIELKVAAKTYHRVASSQLSSNPPLWWSISPLFPNSEKRNRDSERASERERERKKE